MLKKILSYLILSYLILSDNCSRAFNDIVEQAIGNNTHLKPSGKLSHVCEIVIGKEKIKLL